MANQSMSDTHYARRLRGEALPYVRPPAHVVQSQWLQMLTPIGR